MNISLNGNMTRKLITVSSNSSIEEALMLMKSHHIRHLPVTDISSKKIIGFVSDRDLYKSLSSNEVNVGQIMVKDVFKFDLKVSMLDVVDSMIRLKFSAFLVTQFDEVVGIITTEDLLHLLHKFLDEKNFAPTLLEDFVEKFKDLTVPVVGTSTLT